MAEEIYTIPLKRAFGREKRGKNALLIVKEFLKKHTKAEDIKLDPSVSEYIWSKGIKKIPRKIRVKIRKEEDNVIATIV
ncbi:MAG TPA: 50S ribosomal protein L31e [Candidatus Altiarchaeales archaeon]|nr:50S ribosomal protein L31e [Candidatus Altiarchaeales archaeon]